MAARRSKGEDESEATTLTLGDLLYANNAKTRMPAEREWTKLVQAAGAGDQLALHALYERSHRMVFTLVMRIMNNCETAEEVTLDVFHDVWRRAAQYDPANGPVLGWIMNQARSRAIDRIRFEQRKKRVGPRSEEPGEIVAATESENELDLQSRRTLLREALTVLTADERRVIETAFFSDLTYAEVAQRLRLPVGTVKTRIRSGLLKLRQVLATRVKEP